MENYDNEDFFDDDNQANFKLERNAYNRLGLENVLGLGGAVNLKKSGYTDIEKFKLIALATIIIINELFNENYNEEFNGKNYTFNADEIKYILSLIEKIPDFKYKNASAYVLGYIPVFKRFENNTKSIRGQRSIDKYILEDTFKIYDKIEPELSTKIGKTDIIRYARLCSNL